MSRPISYAKRRDIQDAIRAGIPVTRIRSLLSTSAGTISNIKREMGMPMRATRPRRTRVQAVSSPPTAPPTVMHHREIPHSHLERVRELEKLREDSPSNDCDATTEDITSEDVQPAPAPAQAYTPPEYFEAIADGLRSRDAENAALRDEVTSLRSMAARLEGDNLRLLRDLNQCKHQMANWSGPAALPGKNLSNGG